MYNEDKTPEELAEERDRFYIYTSYEEQMDMLTYEQIGRAICALYHYFHTGEKLVQEKEVNMMLSFMTSKLDDDTKHYAKKVRKRRENARNAGLASARARQEKARLAELAESEQYSTTVNDCQRFQPDRDRERDRDNDNERENDRDKDNDGDRDGERERTLCSSNSGRGRSAGEADEHTLILYGANQLPTTSAELHRSEELTRELYSTYMHNKPTRYDYECIFERVHERTVNADGEAYAAYSPVKADLLRYVFKTAAEQQKLGWYYMDGILKKCEDNGIKTAEEALQHEYRWKRGEIA